MELVLLVIAIGLLGVLANTQGAYATDDDPLNEPSFMILGPTRE